MMRARQPMPATTSAPTALLDGAGISRLRDALLRSGFTTEGLVAQLGWDEVLRLWNRGPNPLLPLLADDSDLGVLARFFLYGYNVPATELADALAPLELAEAATAGLIGLEAGAAVPLVRITPYRQAWVLSDPVCGPKERDHVVGLSAYPMYLARTLTGPSVGSALDLCSGSGALSLHLSQCAEQVTATDISPRALRLAATAAALAELKWDLKCGDLAAPVAGRRFDLIAANPPFVIKPGGVGYTYRDSGHPDDSIGARLAAAAATLLSDGGYMHFLTGWIHPTGGDWRERVYEWVADTGLDAWFVELSCAASGDYVRTWASGHEALPAQRDWLDWLTANRIDAIGTGLVVLRAGGNRDPIVRTEELHGWQPITGTDIHAWFNRHDWLTGHNPLDYPLRPDPRLRLVQNATRTPDGWNVEQHQLSIPDSPRIDIVNQLAVDLIEACDGTRTPRQILTDFTVPARRHENMRPHLARLVEHGLLHP